MAIINHVSNNWITSHFLSHRRRLRIADSPREKTFAWTWKHVIFSGDIQMDYDDEERNWDLYTVAGSILITDGYVFSLLIGLPTYHFTYNCTISQNWMKNWIQSLGVCVLVFLYRDETDSSAYCKNVRNCSCNAWMVEIETVKIVVPFEKVQFFFTFFQKR